MSKFEEETYSTIFATLKHPTRRKILRLLSEGPRSFTEMQNLFKVNSPYLTYHLESLKDLVSKTENGRYRLSSMGEGAVALMERVEETPKTTPKYRLSSRWRRILNTFQLAATILAIALILTGWYLTSVTTTEYLYPLPTSSTIRYGVAETVEGDTFTTRISTWVPPPEQLTKLPFFWSSVFSLITLPKEYTISPLGIWNSLQLMAHILLQKGITRDGSCLQE